VNLDEKEITTLFSITCRSKLAFHSIINVATNNLRPLDSKKFKKPHSLYFMQLNTIFCEGVRGSQQTLKGVRGTKF
jgi:hypothetical protein